MSDQSYRAAAIRRLPWLAAALILALAITLLDDSARLRACGRRCARRCVPVYCTPTITPIPIITRSANYGPAGTAAEEETARTATERPGDHEGAPFDIRPNELP